MFKFRLASTLVSRKNYIKANSISSYLLILPISETLKKSIMKKVVLFLSAALLMLCAVSCKNCCQKKANTNEDKVECCKETKACEGKSECCKETKACEGKSECCKETKACEGKSECCK